MSRIELARPDIERIAHGWRGIPDEASSTGMLVWRVRLWLLAAAAALIGITTHQDRLAVAQHAAATQAACAAPAARHARRGAGPVAPAAASDRCPRQAAVFGPADL